jgi:hypothetical protein
MLRGSVVQDLGIYPDANKEDPAEIAERQRRLSDMCIHRYGNFIILCVNKELSIKKFENLLIISILKYHYCTCTKCTHVKISS